jgi:1-aminocyclopropane-1-carboxylate deaminase
MFSFSTADHISLQDISHLYPQPIELSVLRLDQLHETISGNKWFKLRFYIEDAKEHGKSTIVSFGGAWSNHIIATAALCRLEGLQAVGIIRGEEPAILSPTLRQASEYGMKFSFVSREQYRDKFLPPGTDRGESYIIPEGGYGPTGAQGAATILDYCTFNYTHLCCAVGTGTTMAGLINGATPGTRVVGISVMKNNKQLEAAVEALVERPSEWQIFHNYHFGGYAKYEPRLLQFMNDFYKRSGIPTDFVYTAKLFFAVDELIVKNFFPVGSKILIIHSGGLQGNMSLRTGVLQY